MNTLFTNANILTPQGVVRGCLGVAAGAPLADLAVWRLAPPEFYQAVWPFAMLALTLGGIFLPAMLAACLAGRRA